MNKLLKTLEPVVVFITGKYGRKKLVEQGRKIADEQNAPLEILSVIPQSADAYSKAEELEDIYDLSKSVSADDITVYYSDRALQTAAMHVKQAKAKYMVIGLYYPPSEKYVDSLKKMIPDTLFSLSVV